MKIFLNSLKVLGLIFLSLICNMAPIFLLSRQDSFSQPVQWLLGLLYIVFIACVLYALWTFHKKHESDAIKQQTIRGADLGIALLFWLGMRIIAVVGTVANQLYSGQETTANDAALQSLTSFFADGFFLYTFLYVFLIGIIAPIIEELAYRAFPEHLLFKGRSRLLAGFVTTIVFALPHSTNIIEFFTYAGIGALLYLAYQRRGNIRDSILVHILNNLPSAIFLFFMRF
ncbi:CPBP family intramembrane metalloprotease [Streptococcus chenjunshii]|uniref:CPBP family intramembrane metalloprotease n=1 Tax=Streptococcus chenjunshii TaxID=2173853 RepID=A0A372KMQ3_9STRE|nr:type II CAAX endopeptidase family protein [Streptococcus chenjunshii]AXQ78294.1 CPBP family intramembrane metalloprotease [Streptococcus chenjunshii]RFU50741.1 CPBP family intramembrane metalloprotease [Streptococcus chenjunshii]RFU52858.1 CPBP family intramembrane metalloprotease [Streptococcus chenjunshii]